MAAIKSLTFAGGICTAASGGTIDTADITADAVTYAKLQNLSATSRVLGRKTSGSGDAEECTLSEVLDFVGSAAQGDILYRGASAWTRLGAGTSGHFLQTQGAGANPQWAAGSGSLSDGDKGDVVVSSSGSVWTIDADAVTFSKMQNLSASCLVGRRSGSSGDPEEVTLAAPLSLTSGAVLGVWTTAPASQSSTGTAGQMAYDSGRLYVCVATNTWVAFVVDNSGFPA